MRFKQVFYGISMEMYGISMGVLWDSYGILKGFP